MMFCKYCGNQVDPREPVCPACGKAIRLEGGNGFWDIAGEPRPAHPQQDQPSPERERVVEKEVIKWSKTPLLIGALLFALGAALFFVGRFMADKQIASAKESFETQLTQQAEKYDKKLNGLEEKNTEAEEKLAQALAPRPPLEVEKYPTSETKKLDCWNENIFIYRVKSTEASFTWEKQDKNGAWLPLRYNDDGVDEQYGIRLVEDPQKGESILKAAGLTPESEGNYRCIATADGGTASTQVSLTILQRPDEETSLTVQGEFKPGDEPDPDGSFGGEANTDWGVQGGDYYGDYDG